jgi:hypothetical protein
MERTVDKRVYSCWIVVEPAEDMAGTWVSHCLNFDLVSYGDSPADAAGGVCAAIEDAIVDDFQHQRDPSKRGATTPAECWAVLDEILKRGKTVKLSDVPAEAKVKLARQVNFAVVVETIVEPVVMMPRTTTPVSVSPMPLSVPTYESVAAAC